MGRELNESKDQEFYTIASAFQHIKRNKYETDIESKLYFINILYLVKLRVFKAVLCMPTPLDLREQTSPPTVSATCKQI